MPGTQKIVIPDRVGEGREVNYGKSPAPDFGPLARDRIPVRAMTEADLAALIGIDRRITGRDRAEYFGLKMHEALKESDIRVSLVAEQNGMPVGFIMARVDFGEFGRVAPTAVMDTLGVDPDFRNQGVGRALLSQLLANLQTLRVERIRTEVDWHNHALLAFLDRCGFYPSQQLCLDHPIRN
ncbi:MAG TPA: GNAT family N-acetyltransferase [Xanthobacteraceae bacterium]|nr:GNAT family N-acetyltransferase [Xanthobacteraceae bacterium]